MLNAEALEVEGFEGVLSPAAEALEDEGVLRPATEALEDEGFEGFLRVVTEMLDEDEGCEAACG